MGRRRARPASSAHVTRSHDVPLFQCYLNLLPMTYFLVKAKTKRNEAFSGKSLQKTPYFLQTGRF
jgi:hypothetical protein